MEANKLQQLKELIEKRPKVYGWFFVQRILFWIFLLSGTFMLSITLFEVQILFYKEVCEACTNEADWEDESTKDALQKLISSLCSIFFPVKSLSVFRDLVISVLLFALARYSRKVLMRNRYILEIQKLVIKE